MLKLAEADLRWRQEDRRRRGEAVARLRVDRGSRRLVLKLLKVLERLSRVLEAGRDGLAKLERRRRERGLLLRREPERVGRRRERVRVEVHRGGSVE